MIRVKGNTDLARDTKSKAIINTNTQAYHSFIARKKKQHDFENRLSALETSINEILAILKHDHNN